MAVGSVAWILHFLLLGSWAGALGNLISGIRWGCARYVKHKNWRHIILMAILAAYATTAWLTAHHWYEVVPLFGSAVNSVGVFLLSGNAMRLAVMASSVCWLGYSALLGSIGGILNEVTVSTLNTITMLRKHKLIITPAAQH